MSTEEREYKDQYFPLYKSHTQGSTVKEASVQDVNPAYLKWRKWSRIFFALGVLFLGWTFYKAFLTEGKPKNAMVAAGVPKPAMPCLKDLQQQSEPAAVAMPVAATAVPAAPMVPAAPARPSMGPDPLENRLLHLTGCMVKKTTGERICTMTVSQNGMPVFQITDKELEEVGFKFRYVGHCAAHVSWDGVIRAVVCDAPSIGMRVAGFSKGS